MSRTFVGFGFGPIQSGLFVYEAQRTGRFERFAIAEVDAAAVAAVREAGGRYTLNIARPDRVDAVTLEGVELLNPNDPADREALVEAVSRADELGTALPSVRFYDSGDASVAKLLAEGLARRRADRPAALYAAENHNHAAELLTEALARHARPECLRSFQALNTVIGKMSGVITDAETIGRLGLAPITPGATRAVLVEQFNRILISRIELAGFERGIDAFVEKDDLLPFEEAKLHGHNATHALIGYLADRRGHRTIADAGHDQWIMSVARSAFLDESGSALIHRHAALGEELFTPAGYRAYAEDLLARMTNPHLNDLVARVGRDPVRKLAYDDRLYGTMRLALEAGIQPKNYALGAAAGVEFLVRRRDFGHLSLPPLPQDPADIGRQLLAEILGAIWGDHSDAHRERLVELTWEALGRLRGL